MKNYDREFLKNKLYFKGIMYRFGVRQEDMEEMYHDLYIHIRKKISEGKYTEEGKIAKWMGVVLRGLIIDGHRRNNRHKLPILDFEDDNLNEFIKNSITDGLTVENKLIDDEVMTRAMEVFNGLREDQRSVLHRWIFLGKSMKDIAEEDGDSLNTILGRARYGRINMRKKF